MSYIIDQIDIAEQAIQCSFEGCNGIAKMVKRTSGENDGKLYWDQHLKYVDYTEEDFYSLDCEIVKYKRMLKALEKLLLYVQERLGYLESDNSVKDIIRFEQWKKELDSEVNILKSILESMMTNAKCLAEKANIDSFSFIKASVERCRESISKILRMIFDILLKPYIDTLVKVIVESTENFEEELGITQETPIPHIIYENSHKLFTVPIQSLKKVEDLQK